jgi:hydrogenase maturation protease
MSELGRGEVVVVGLGNPLMADDGLGLVALERLRLEWRLPASVCLVDGGTWGMNLLPLVEDAERILFIDAIDLGRPPGDLIRLEGDELPRFFAQKLSPHQIDLREVLAVAELRGRLPRHLVAIGLQPGRLEMASGLSPELGARLDDLLRAVVDRLERWGFSAQALESLANA